MSEDRGKYNINNKDRIVSHSVKITITDTNSIRVHEIIRELYRLGALDKEQAECLLAFCEYF